MTYAYAFVHDGWDDCVCYDVVAICYYSLLFTIIERGNQRE